MLHRQGKILYDAIITGAADRICPIVMTTSTTIFGLLLFVLFAEEKISIWFSLALSMIGGAVTSMVFVLTVIRVFYSLVERYTWKK